MEIKIIPKDSGGTEFLAQPHRLHLGGRRAAGVDRLTFRLPEAWDKLAVTLYLEHPDGADPTAILLDESRTLPVDRRLTGRPAGRWMLAATDGSGYTAYTRPGTYDVYEVLATDGAQTQAPEPTVFEQFVARVLESAGRAGTAAAQAETCAAQAQQAAGQAESDRSDAADAAARAEAAALRAEGVAPSEGAVISVNGKGGIVRLTAQEVGALPQPVSAAAGELLRVRQIDPDTGALTLDTADGLVKTDAAYGVCAQADGTLATAAATEAQLDAMTDTYAPLVPALLPYGVKKALTGGADAARWTDEERAAARALLATDASGALQALEARLTALELRTSDLRFQYGFAAPDALELTGRWNAEDARLEF